MKYIDFLSVAGAGLLLTTNPSGAEDAASTGLSEPVLQGAGEVSWERQRSNGAFTRARISLPDERIILSAEGDVFEPGGRVEALRFEGPPQTEWFVDGGDFEIAVSKDADVVAGVEWAADGILDVHRWDTLFSAPPWSASLTPAWPVSSIRDTVSVSRDGSTIATLVQQAGVSRVYVFEPDSPEWVDARAVNQLYPGNVAVSDDGLVVGFSAGGRIYALRRETGALLQVTNSGSSFAMSADGSRFAHGLTSLGAQGGFWMKLLEWNGTAYEQVFLRGRGGASLSRVAIDAAGETMVAAWERDGSSETVYIDVHTLPSLTPDWTFEYRTSTSSYLVTNIAMTRDGRYFAVSTYNFVASPFSDEAVNPEVHVFERDSPDPVLIFDTPGPMLDVDIARTPGGVIRIAAAGERPFPLTGGEAYSIRLQTACTADVDGDGRVGFNDLLPILGAWGPYAPCPPFVVPDVDRNCAVGFTDIVAVLAAWGPCDG